MIFLPPHRHCEIWWRMHKWRGDDTDTLMDITARQKNNEEVVLWPSVRTKKIRENACSRTTLDNSIPLQKRPFWRRVSMDTKGDVGAELWVWRLCLQAFFSFFSPGTIVFLSLVIGCSSLFLRTRRKWRDLEWHSRCSACLFGHVTHDTRESAQSAERFFHGSVKLQEFEGQTLLEMTGEGTAQVGPVHDDEIGVLGLQDTFLHMVREHSYCERRMGPRTAEPSAWMSDIWPIKWLWRGKSP